MATGPQGQKRILVTAGWLGGAGGAERALWSILQALEEDRVDLVVRTVLTEGWSSVPRNVRVFTTRHWRWRAANSKGAVSRHISRRLLNPLRRLVNPRYDLHIAFFHGPNVTGAAHASMRFMNLSGRSLSETSHPVDMVLLQAPDNALLVSNGVRTAVVPPPFRPLAEACAAPEVSLPDEFGLTVFNPYGPVKGVDDLRRVVERLPFPLVWCHSNQTSHHEIPHDLIVHPNLIHIENPRPDELRYLYENCLSYFCFSKSEGFGWSIADALQFSRNIVSREIGVLSFPEAKVEGVHFVDSHWDFEATDLQRTNLPSQRDLSWLSADAFRSTLLRLLRDGQ